MNHRTTESNIDFLPLPVDESGWIEKCKFYKKGETMPCNYKDYPENWKWLSKQIIKDAGDKCELCYAPNGSEIVWNKFWRHPWKYACEVNSHAGYKITKVILTVHHIDGDKTNNAKQNLIALCQRHHLRLDLQKHMKNRKRNRKNEHQTQISL